MSVHFLIDSSDPVKLKKAVQTANEMARQQVSEDTVGVVFLGAIPRGYFDDAADIDIVLFKRPLPEGTVNPQFVKVDGFEVHYHFEDYDSARESAWDMSKRWAFSQREIAYDPQGLIAQLLQEKVPLRPEEKRWLLMSGLVLSEWYINRLACLWIERGNIISAHHMFYQGLNYFFDMLFALNDELVADMKWRYYCAEKLPLLPANFRERIQEVLLLNAVTVEEIQRRREAFLTMWREMAPIVEREVGMPYEEIMNAV